MVKISIIVPVYNAEKNLINGIKCILNQTFTDFEVILVNDGSTDNSGRLCDEVSKEDNRIKVIHKKNEGSGPTRNVGIDASKGKYIMFYDSDDILESNMLEEMYNLIEGKKVDLVICSYKDVGIRDGEVFIKRENEIEEYETYNQHDVRQYYYTLYKRCMIQAPWAKLYKSSIIKEKNIRFPDLRRCQDSIFNIDYYECISSIFISNKKLYNYVTLDGLEYLNKFPKDMFNILRYVNEYITIKMKNWNIFDEEKKNYFSQIMIRDAFIAIRICFNKNWRMNRIERNNYIKSIVSDSYLLSCLDSDQQGINKIIAKLISCKNISIIVICSNILILKQKIFK